MNVEEQVRERVKNRLEDSVSVRTIFDQVSGKAIKQADQVWNPLRDKIIEQVKSKVVDQVRGQIRPNIIRRVNQARNDI